MTKTVAGSPANVTIATHIKHCVRRSRQTTDESVTFFQRRRPTNIRTRRIISVMKAERTLILLWFVCEIVQEPVQSERRGEMLYAREAILPRNTAQAIVMMNLLRSQIAATRRMINADEKVNVRFPNTCKVTNWSRKWHSDGTRHLTKAETTHAWQSILCDTSRPIISNVTANRAHQRHPRYSYHAHQVGHAVFSISKSTDSAPGMTM
jgi:hypothetical protein